MDGVVDELGLLHLVGLLGDLTHPRRGGGLSDFGVENTDQIF